MKFEKIIKYFECSIKKKKTENRFVNKLIE